MNIDKTYVIFSKEKIFWHLAHTSPDLMVWRKAASLYFIGACVHWFLNIVSESGVRSAILPYWRGIFFQLDRGRRRVTDDLEFLAAGPLVSYARNSLSEIERFYDGDGREVKRKKQNFVEDPNATTWPFGEWVADNTIYYIRSSILGGAVVSETYPLGQKKKTFVMAAGAKIATQSAYLWSGASNQSVSWEHTDASGMSYRSTMSNGYAVYGDGSYDGAPAEFDPMGGNMGTYTPYVEPQYIDPPPEPTEIFPYLLIDGGSPMYVNGQQVSCTLDGMSIGCSMAINMLDTGSAIPASIAWAQNLPRFRFNHMDWEIIPLPYRGIISKLQAAAAPVPTMIRYESEVGAINRHVPGHSISIRLGHRKAK